MRREKYLIFKHLSFWLRIALFGLLYYLFSLNVVDNYNFYDYAFHPRLFGAQYLVIMILIIIAVPVFVITYFAFSDYLDYPDEGRALEGVFVGFSGILLLFWLRHGFYQTPADLAIAITNFVFMIISLFMLIIQEFVEEDYSYQNCSHDELVDEVCDKIFETKLYQNNFNSVMTKVDFIKKLGSENDEYFKTVNLYNLPQKFRDFVKNHNCKILFEYKRNSMELSYKHYYKFIKQQYKNESQFSDLLFNYKNLKKEEKEFDKDYYPAIVALFKKKDFVEATSKVEKLLADSKDMVPSKNKVIRELQQTALQKISDIESRISELLRKINEAIPESKIKQQDLIDLINQISVDNELLKDIDKTSKYVRNVIEIPTKLNDTIDYCNKLIIHLNLSDENKIGSFLLDSPTVSIEEAHKFDNLIKTLKEKGNEFKKIIACDEFADLVVKILLKGRSIDEASTEALNNYNISEYKENCIKYKQYLELANNSPLFLGRTYIENNDSINLKKLLGISEYIDKLSKERDRDGNNILHYLTNKPSKEIINCFIDRFYHVEELAFEPNNNLKIPFDNIIVYDMFSKKIEKARYTYESIFGNKSETFLSNQCRTAINKLRKNPLIGKNWTDYFNRAINENFLPQCHSEIFNELSDYEVPNTFKLLQLLDSVPEVFFFKHIRSDVSKLLKEKIESFDLDKYQQAENISSSLLNLTYSSRASGSFNEKEYSSDKPAAVQITAILNGIICLLEDLEEGPILNFVNSSKNKYVKIAKDVYKENQNKDLYRAISSFDPDFRESNSILDEVCVLLGLPVGTEPEEVGKAWKKQKFMALKKRDKTEEEKLNELQQKLSYLQRVYPNLKIF